MLRATVSSPRCTSCDSTREVLGLIGGAKVLSLDSAHRGHGTELYRQPTGCTGSAGRKLQSRVGGLAVVRCSPGERPVPAPNVPSLRGIRARGLPFLRELRPSSDGHL